MQALDKKDLKLLLVIRHFELMLLDLFSQGKLQGTTHTCLGQEYIPVALKPFLTDKDYTFSNHRGHGHYLSRFEDPESLLAEIMGKEGAICNGMGGSQHIKRDRYMSTGVQGEGIAMASGVALHLKQHEKGSLAIVFIGDGTWGQGVVYETLNIASLLELPLIVIVENNGIAQTTPIDLNMAGSIEDRVKAFGIHYLKITGSDISKIRSAVKEPIKQSRKEMTPFVIEFHTIRLGPHSKGDDVRDNEVISKVKEQDWYEVLKQQKLDYFHVLEESIKTSLLQLYEEIEQRRESFGGSRNGT